MSRIEITPASLELAIAVLKAAQLREESYDHSAANKASREAMDNGYGTVDYSKFYRVSLEDAAMKASPSMGQLIYFTLYYAWNDASDWAKVVVDASKVVQK